MNQFFFLTSYDNISGSIIASLLNTHPDIACSVSHSDPFIPHAKLSDADHTESSLDEFIVTHTDSEKKFSGNAQRFSAYQLQHKLIAEKTVEPFRKVNLLISPFLHIDLLLHSWKQTDSAKIIEEQLKILKKQKHSVYSLYTFHHFFHDVFALVEKEKLADIHDEKTRLFLLALTKVLAFDSADIPTTGKAVCFEKLLANEEELLELIRYVTRNQAHIDSDFIMQLRLSLHNANAQINSISGSTWQPWQNQLVKRLLGMRLRTVYYPHIDKPLSNFYYTAGYQLLQENTQPYSKLISIQLNSNRPAQLSAYFDNIEETADNPEAIEVIVNIDSDSTVMKSLVENEIPRRKFTLKYIETERPASFCDLWKPLNKILDVTDPDCYFLLNISDEMFFLTQGWDSVLKKYVGFFPDHLFRLRASRNKFRNYFDRWECSFAQDSIPITTKKWVDVGGDWNPCFGPDSFQELISFYLAKEGKFSNENYLRELPLLDIPFSGDVPFIGIAESKKWKHERDHIYAMQIAQSYPMQLEARRRAILIKAHITAYKLQLSHFEIKDIKSKKVIQLIDTEKNTVITQLDYNLNRVSIWLVNQWRKLHFFDYFGGGFEHQQSSLIGLFRYLKAKYRGMNFIYRALRFIKRRILLKLSKQT